MGEKPGWKHHQENRLYLNRSQVPECSTKGAKNTMMACKHGTTKTTQCHTNEHMSKTNEAIKESAPQGNRNADKIRRTRTKKRPTKNSKMDRAKRHTHRNTTRGKCRRAMGETEENHTDRTKRMLPLTNTKNEKTTPEWATAIKQWSAQDEWEELQQQYNRRQTLQAKITELDRQSKKPQERKKMLQSLEAWKQATEYLRKP